MRARRRNVLPAAVGATIGASLWTGAARGGAQALAQPIGTIAVGQRADLVVLDATDPALADQDRHDVLDAAIFGPSQPPGARRAGTRPLRRARRTPRAGGGRVRALSRHARAARAAGMTPARFDLLLVDAHLATMRADAGAYGAIRDGAVGIVGDTIAWVGRRGDLPRDVAAATTLACAGAWITPGLVDCHTHLVYAGNRVRRVRAPAAWAPRMPTSRARAAASPPPCARRARRTTAALAAQSRPRMAALAAEGVTTIEVKSGYGLDTAAELKQLRVARTLGERAGRDGADDAARRARGAAGVRGSRRRLRRLRVRRHDPRRRARRAADAVDAFCETIGFTPAQTRRVFAARVRTGCPSSCTPTSCPTPVAARSRQRRRRLSADHLEYTNDAGVAAMARAGTVAVLLPGAFYALRETRLPPVAAFRREGVPIAISTDCNPGTSPTTSLLLMLNMACTLFGLTPEEALMGATVHAARALGLNDRGTLAPGQRADLACWAIAEPAELAYRIGGAPPARIVRGGRVADGD